MSELKALVGQIVQNPEMLKSLVTQIRDPKSLARAAGLNSQHCDMLTGIGGALSGLLNQVAKPPSQPSRRVSSLPCGNSVSPRRKNTAVVGVVSLVAMTGAIAALGAVSAAALSNRSRNPQP